MPTIPTDAYRYLEKSVFLPMLIKVLKQDLEMILQLPFKLNRPYIGMVENALQAVKSDLKTSDIYLKRHDLRVIRESMTETQSNYVFIYIGFEERKSYMNNEIRQRTEEMLSTYLTK